MPLGSDRPSALRRVKDTLSASVVAASNGLLRLVSAKRRAEYQGSLVHWGPICYRDSGMVQRVSCLPEYKRVEGWKKEPETVEWLEKNIQPGDTFFDVGSNVGSYSLIAFAASKRTAEVVAFEPNPQNYAAACANFERNKVKGMVLPLALGLKRDMVRLEGSLTEAGPTSISHGEGNVTVLAESLDQLIEERGLPQPNLIKMDVDGAEGLVLRGAVKVLRNPALRSIILEIDNEHPDTISILSWLETQGWKVASRHSRLSARYENVILGRVEVPAVVS